MLSSLYKFGAWLLLKLATIVLISVLGLTAFALWLFLNDTSDFYSSQAGRVAQLATQHANLTASKQSLDARLAELQREESLQKDHLYRADRIIENLHELDTWMNRIFGDGAQRRMNLEQIARMETLKRVANVRLAEIQRALHRDRIELSHVEKQLAPLDRRLQALEQNHSAVTYYLLEAFELAKWWALGIVTWYFFGPLLTRSFLYYFIAPPLSRSRPIRFAREIGAMPRVGESRETLTSSLWPGEILRVKDRYLQTYDPSLERKKKRFLDWKLPLTSLACGLTELVELRNIRAGADGRVVLSALDNPSGELAVVHVPEGSSLVLRPSYLVGMIQPSDEPLKIRRRWALFRWQSWVSLQFRYLEFAGPCRLVMAGRPSMRVENVTMPDGSSPSKRRAPQHAIIGFTPNLDYKPLRSERFRHYLRGVSRLFDDSFSGGTGFFLTLAVAHVNPRRRSWGSFRSRFFKIFGI